MQAQKHRLINAFEKNTLAPIEWVSLPFKNLTIEVATDALKAPIDDRSAVRLPVSYADTIAICKALECIPPTQEICDLIYNKAIRLYAVPLVSNLSDSLKMCTLEFTLKFDARIKEQLAGRRGLVTGAWKHWILHPRIVERGAVNYGFWGVRGRPIQSPGARHDAAHWDYSQLLQPIKRYALDVSTGKYIDLLDLISIPNRYKNQYRGEEVGCGERH